MKEKMFRGRLGLRGFILGFFYYTITALILFTVPSLLLGILDAIWGVADQIANTINVIFALVAIVFCLVGFISLFVRRAHDIDMPDQWAYKAMLSFGWNPSIGSSRLISQAGTAKENDYGKPMNSLSYFRIVGLK